MPANEVIIKPQNNTSLFQEFIKNSTKSPSRKAQQNFLNIITSVADIIKKICVSEKLIFDVSYDGKNIGNKQKNTKPVLLTEVFTAASYQAPLLLPSVLKATL